MTFIPDKSDIQASYVVANSPTDQYPDQEELGRVREKLREEFKDWHRKEILKAKRETITEVILEIRAIPCWRDPVTGLGGFDLADDGTEHGAYNEVMKVLRDIRSEIQ